MEISFGELEQIADYQTLASAFFSVATPEQIARVAMEVGNPIFGEDNELIGFEPSMADYEPDESWFDEDALNSIGWGVDEAYM
jgi:hypothetical protein